MSNIDSADWYPSCVVTLTLRFDEALQIGGVSSAEASAAATARAKAAQTTASRAAANQRPRAAMNVEALPGLRNVNRVLSQHDSLAGIHRTSPSSRGEALGSGLGSLIQQFRPKPHAGAGGGTGQPTDETSKPLALAAGIDVAPLTFGTDGFTVIANRVPAKGTFKLPHPRAAGTFSLTFDYHEFPIDPRLLRNVGVDVHIGAVSAENYVRGMNGEKDSDGHPLSIIKTTGGLIDPFSGRPATNGQTLLFHATCDTWEVDHSDSGSIVMLEGRDIRGIFLDAKIAPAKIAKIDLTKPINKVVQDIIHTMGLDFDLKMTVITDAAEWPEGKIPSPGDIEGMTRVRLGAGGDKPGSTPANGAKASYWDLITNYCTIVGALPMIYGSALWIRPNQSIFAITDPHTTIPTPFAGGGTRTTGTEQFRVRRMVYGRDVKRLRFQRKFAGAIVPTVKCVSFDDRAKGTQRLIFGQWPPADSPQALMKAETETLNVPIYGLRSVGQLVQAARGIYEEIGRGETGGTADTANLASFAGSNADPDILRAKPMEPIEFLIDVSALRSIAPVTSELNDNARRTFSEEVDILTQRLGDRAIARALTAMARGAIRELLAFYQVIEVQHDWEAGSGIHTAFGFQNYIVPRNLVAGAPIGKPDYQAARVETVGAHNKAKAKELAKRAAGPGGVHGPVDTSKIPGFTRSRRRGGQVPP